MSITTERTEREKPISSLDFFKFIAMLLIVWWHFGNPTRRFDIGARMCEFLFVASGFLVGYNYYKRGMTESRKQSFKYVIKKIISVYPVYLIAMIFYIIVNREKYILGFSASQIPSLFLNLFMLQAWSPYESVFFDYNGSSWFISSLMFCYFMSPLFLQYLRNNKYKIMLPIIVAIRVLIQFVPETVGSFPLGLNYHVSPIIRCLEFFIGMLTIPLFFRCKEKVNSIEKNQATIKVIFTGFEILLPVLYYFLMVKLNDIFPRWAFVLLFCPFVFFYAFDYGYFSKLCSFKIFKKIASLQLYFYLFQYMASFITDKLCGLLNGNIIINYYVLKLLVLSACAIIYKLALEKHITKFFKKVVYSLARLLSYN